jgi:predicted nucleotide-binding protein
MNANEALQSLQALISEFRGFSAGSMGDINITGIKVVAEKTEVFVRAVLGNDSIYITKLAAVGYEYLELPYFSPEYWQAIQKSITQIASILRALEYDLQTFGLSPVTAATEMNIDVNKVFIVHGHDKLMIAHVRDIVKRLKLQPIILAEKPGENKTLIEKFLKHSSVGYAIVLISPDDELPATGGILTKRPRQNVIFELGFFIGRLPRERVYVLARDIDLIEIPSDYSGVEYHKFDEDFQWADSLVQEMNNVGYDLSYDLLKNDK